MQTLLFRDDWDEGWEEGGKERMRRKAGRSILESECNGARAPVSRGIVGSRNLSKSEVCVTSFRNTSEITGVLFEDLGECGATIESKGDRSEKRTSKAKP